MIELIPFDLQRAIAGDKLITRGGLDVLEFHYFIKISPKKEVSCAAVLPFGWGDSLCLYDRYGNYVSREGDIYNRHFDLFMKYSEENKNNG